MTIEIVDFPINSMVIFYSYVSLPEGIWVKMQVMAKSGIKHWLLWLKLIMHSSYPPTIWGAPKTIAWPT